jgi:membrane protein YdbS with pleckstrin-like domain
MAADGFPGSVLSSEEDLVFDLRPHWISLAQPFALTLALVAALAIVWLVMPYSWGGWAYVVTGLIAAGLLLAGPAQPFVRWLTSHFVLTTSRVIRRSGWIAKESIEIPLDKISDVRFHQSVLERLLKAGDLTIESAGRSGQERLENCRDPERIQRLIYEMKERAMGRDDPIHGATLMPQTWGPASVADEVAKLYELVERGVISGEEFQAAKTKLLRRV